MIPSSEPKRPPLKEGRRFIDAEERFFWWDEATSPAWVVAPGELVSIAAVDGWNGRITSADDTAGDCPPGETNPCSGPIRVEGALPGRTLVFEIGEVVCDSDRAVSVIMPGWGVLGDRVAEPKTYVLPLKDGTVQLPGGVRVPAKPMVGTIGVTPAGERVPTLVPGDFGGNMDVPEMGTGSTLFLPIQVEGGNFGLGDSKALMGEGESAAAGAEVPVTVHGRFDVIAAHRIRIPLLRTEDRWIAVSSGETVEMAAESAFDQMVELVSVELDLSWQDSRLFAGIAGSMRICQTANPLVSVAFHLPRQAVDFSWAAEAFA